MKTRCTEVTNHDHQWEVYLRCAFFLFLVVCFFLITSSGCLKSGAFLVSFWAGEHGSTLVITTTQTCIFFFVLVFPPWSRSVGHTTPVRVRSPVFNARLLSYCWKTAKKQQQQKKTKAKNRRKRCHDFFAVNVCTLCFFAIV